MKKSSFNTLCCVSCGQFVYFGWNSTSKLPVAIEPFRQLLHMLTWYLSIRDRGIIHYQLVLLQLDTPLNNSCPVVRLEPVTRVGRQPDCQL